MTETGLGISSPIFFVGVVEGNSDPRLEGRVQVRAFGIHGTVQQIPSAELPWAPVMNGIIPPLNSWVLGFMIDGRDAQQPMVLGVIPTQMNSEINPEVTGWGVIPQAHLDLLSQGSRAVDFGQPTIPRLARGEYLEQTYMPSVQATREMGVPVTNGESWDEPGAAYAAKYPFNKVIETAAGHSVEIDDTPGEERIMIYHKAGSYVQIDSRGTTSHKTVSDKFDVTDGNFHIFIGGSAKVTVDQDAHFLVNGNMYHEVMGDMSLSVHGNMDIAAGGQLNLYAADQVQVSGSRVAISAKVADVNVLAASDVKLTGMSSLNLKSSGPARLEAGGLLSLKASGNLAMDGSEIRALEGASESAGVASGASTPEPISGSSFNNSTRYSSIGTSNAYSVDDYEESYDDTIPLDDMANMDQSPELVSFIKQYEGKARLNAWWDSKQHSIGYGTKANSPNETITIQEAERRFAEDLSFRRAYVNRWQAARGRGWSSEQIDAMTSFIYNGGTGWLDQVTADNTRSDEEIARMMLEYHNADGKYSEGLQRRRNAEAAWFRRGMAKGGTSI